MGLLESRKLQGVLVFDMVGGDVDRRASEREAISPARAHLGAAAAAAYGGEVRAGQQDLLERFGE